MLGIREMSVQVHCPFSLVNWVVCLFSWPNNLPYVTHSVQSQRQIPNSHIHTPNPGIYNVQNQQHSCPARPPLKASSSPFPTCLPVIYGLTLLKWKPQNKRHCRNTYPVKLNMYSANNSESLPSAEPKEIPEEYISWLWEFKRWARQEF